MNTVGKVSAVVLATIIGVVLIGAVVLAGWQIGWWFRVHNVNRQAQLAQSGYAAQSADISQAQSLIVQVGTINTQIPGSSPNEQAALEAQRADIIAQACNVISQIQIAVPSNVSQFAAANCQGG